MPGPPGAGYSAYSFSQTGQALTSVANLWVDALVTSTPFTSGGNSATADLLASGSITAINAGPTASCALRFVIDGTTSGDPIYGDRLITVTLGQWHAFTLMQRVTLAAAGPHNAKVQLARVSADGTECQIDGGEYSLVRLLISVR